MTNEDIEAEAFYDGDCPLCSREVVWLHKRDTNERIRFIDIAAPQFDADRDAGFPVCRADCIQARLASGEVLEGTDAFHQLYAIVESPQEQKPARLRVILPALDFGHRLITRRRLRITERQVAHTCATIRAGH